MASTEAHSAPSSSPLISGTTRRTHPYIVSSAPPVANTPTSAADISPQSNAYSTAVAPDSSDQKRRLGIGFVTVSRLQSKQISKMADQRFVGWRHREVPQPSGLHPFQLLRFTRDRHTFPPPADEQWHEKMKIGIIVT